ncbi:hypothetical protein Tco_0845074 [Tanacetum coccineum]
MSWLLPPGRNAPPSKQGRKIDDLRYADVEVTLVDETQERNDEDLMFDTGVLDGDKVFEEPMVNIALTTSLISVKTLIEIKAAKPKAVTTAATITTTIIPKARWVVVQEPSEFKTTTSSPSQVSQLPQTKDKDMAIMVEHEKPLKKKDQIALHEELAFKLHAEEQVELERIQRDD